MGYRLVACLLIAISTLGAQANAQEAPSASEKDIATLRSAILRSAESFNKGMKDFQVWRRESDGTWKFARGMHYRMQEEVPPS